MATGLTPYATPGKLAIRNPVFVLVLGFALLPPWLMMPVGGATYIASTDLLLVFAVYCLFARRTVQMPIIAKMYLAYVLAAVLSCFIHILVGSQSSIVPMLQVLRAYVIFFPFLAIFQLRHFDEQMLRRVVHWASIGCGIGVFAGIIIFELGIQVREAQTQQLWLGNGQGSVPRAGGLPGNSGSYGMLLAVWAIILFFVRPVLGLRLPLWMAATAGLALAYGFQISSSRGGLIQVLAAMGLYAALILPAHPKRALVAAMAAIAAIAIGGVLIAGAIENNPALARSIARLDILNLTGQSAFFQTVRLSSWTILPSLIAEHWQIGVGYKQFYPTYGFYIDNAYMLAFFETGLLTFVLFQLFWFGLLIHGCLLLTGGNIYARLFLIILIPFMVRLFTGGANTEWSVGPVVFVLLGATYRMALIRNAELRGGAR